jgi:predicted cupin superfamily sugar epimerase
VDKQYWINRLELQHHPEGGFYQEIYRCKENVLHNGQIKSACTSIYYLIESETKSFCHRLKCDELWYHHQGASVALYLIDEYGSWSMKICGAGEGENLTVLIPQNTWFGARVMDPESFSLVSCVVSPGFEFADFEMIDRNELINLFPQHKEEILQYTLK